MRSSLLTHTYTLSPSTSPPQPHSSPAVFSDLLPKLGALAAAGYSLEPSLRQLQALAASDPEALCCVEGFTLARRGVGTLRWLVPVDVRGLELEHIARIDQGGCGTAVGVRGAQGLVPHLFDPHCCCPSSLCTHTLCPPPFLSPLTHTIIPQVRWLCTLRAASPRWALSSTPRVR